MNWSGCEGEINFGYDRKELKKVSQDLHVN